MGFHAGRRGSAVLKMWFTDPNDMRVKDALTKRCGLCGAPKGVPCHSITDKPLNRPVHIYRLEVP